MDVHKFSRILFVFCILFSFLFFISGICAEDFSENSTFVNQSSELSVVDDYENDDLLAKTYSLNGGKFSDLQELIDKAKKGDTIKLSGSFKSEGKQITIDKQLTITSSSTATLNGNSKSRIFHIEDKAKGTVISNIVFKNAKSEHRGGAIYLEASNVKIDKCTFKDCVGHSGGAIATPNNSNADSLTISNSKFTSNNADYVGGAISYIAKKLQITSCIFDSNYLKLTSKNDGGSGGVLQIGISNATNNCKITNCIFNNNYVTPYNEVIKGHAGVACLRRDVSFINCNFTNNHAHDGGVLTFHDGGAVINCRFTNNYAIGYAGAIQTDSTTQPLTISQSIFEDNSAEYAGAIALIGNLNVKIEKTNFINNNVETFGAGIWAENSKLLMIVIFQKILQNMLVLLH